MHITRQLHVRCKSLRLTHRTNTRTSYYNKEHKFSNHFINALLDKATPTITLLHNLGLSLYYMAEHNSTEFYLHIFNYTQIYTYIYIHINQISYKYSKHFTSIEQGKM